MSTASSGRRVQLGSCAAVTEPAVPLVARVARAVAWLFNPVLNPRVGPSLDITQEELGQIAGVSRQVANRALQILEAEGLLKLSPSGLTPCDVKALARYGD